MTVGQSYIVVDPSSSTVEDLVDKAFYGAKINKAEGKLTIDRIVGDEPIQLPETYLQKNIEYVNWFWSHNSFKFSWGANGHLILEVL